VVLINTRAPAAEFFVPAFDGVSEYVPEHVAERVSVSFAATNFTAFATEDLKISPRAFIAPPIERMIPALL
jgi:hypothetical protein